MGLNYELSGIDNWQALLDFENKCQPMTQAIIFAAMSVGIGTITEKNHIEFYMRLTASDAISQWPGRGFDITLADVKRHIGLRTNVSLETRSRWVKNLFDNTEREIRYRQRRDEEIVVTPKIDGTDPIDWRAGADGIR